MAHGVAAPIERRPACMPPRLHIEGAGFGNGPRCPLSLMAVRWRRSPGSMTRKNRWPRPMPAHVPAGGAFPDRCTTPAVDLVSVTRRGGCRPGDPAGVRLSMERSRAGQTPGAFSMAWRTFGRAWSLYQASICSRLAAAGAASFPPTSSAQAWAMATRRRENSCT